MATKPGLYANILAKRARIEAGSKKKCAKWVVKVRQLPKILKIQLKLQRKNNHAIKKIS